MLWAAPTQLVNGKMRWRVSGSNLVPVKSVINGKDQDVYFARPVLRLILRQPMQIAGVEGEFDVCATVKGGGLTGQAGAVKHGWSNLNVSA